MLNDSSPSQSWDFVEEPDWTRPAPEPAARGGEFDSVNWYFRRIAKMPLLKAPEERALCERIEAAQHALSATLLAVPSTADRFAEIAAGIRRGTGVPDDLLQSPDGCALQSGDVALALVRLTRVRRQAAALARVDAALAAERVAATHRADLTRVPISSSPR